MKRLIKLTFLIFVSLSVSAQVSINFDELKKVNNKNDFTKVLLTNNFEIISENNSKLTLAYGFNDLDSTAQVWAHYYNSLKTFEFIIYDVDYYDNNIEIGLYQKLTEEIKECNYVQSFINGFGFEDNLTYMLYTCPTSTYNGKIGFCLKTEGGMKVGRIVTFDNGYIKFCEATREVDK